MNKRLILAAIIAALTFPSSTAVSGNRESQADKNRSVIKAEVRGTLRFQHGNGYFIAVSSNANPGSENRVWLRISEDKVLVRRLEGLMEKEVIANGELEQMPENVRTSVPPNGMYLRNVEIEGTSVDAGQNSAQSTNEETCSGPIYNSKEVTHRAKITHLSEPRYTEEARTRGVRGTVVLRAIFCRTGKVTNIEVVQSVPYGLTENAIEATRRIKFKPAEKEGEVVSQHFRRECSFNLY